MWTSYHRLFVKTKKLTLVQYYYIKYKIYSDLISFLLTSLFLFEILVQDSTLQLSCHCSFSNLWPFLSLVFLFWQFWRVLVRSFVECFSVCVCLMFSHGWIELKRHWEGYLKWSLLSVVHVSNHASLAGDVNLDHLARAICQNPQLYFPL